MRTRVRAHTVVCSVHVFGYNNGRVCVQQSGLTLYCIVCMCLGTTMEECAYNSQGSHSSVHVFGYNNGRVCIQQSGLTL